MCRSDTWRMRKVSRGMTHSLLLLQDLGPRPARLLDLEWLQFEHQPFRPVRQLAPITPDTFLGGRLLQFLLEAAQDRVGLAGGDRQALQQLRPYSRPEVLPVRDRQFLLAL